MQNESTTITNLRKEGKLNEAYSFGKDAVQKYPEGLYIKRAFAWVIHDLLKKNASYSMRDTFFKYFADIEPLNLTAEESLFFDSVAWDVRSIVSDAVNRKVTDYAFYSRAAGVVGGLPITRPGDAYSSLLQVFLKVTPEWSGRLAFVKWWDLANLRDKDFEKYETDSGTKVMSLAEKAYIALAKLSLASGNTQEMETALPMIAGIYQEHREFVYMPYYEAKILIALGRSGEAMEKLKPFARKKDGQFWVWELIGDACSDIHQRFSNYCKALMCKSKDEMLVSLREKAAAVFRDLGHLPQARLEADKAAATRQGQGWKLTSALAALMAEDWYSSTQPAKGNYNFYSQNCEAAEAFVFGKRKNPKPQKAAAKQPQEDFKGKIRISPAGFGFVGFGDNAVYVPAPLVKQSGVADGAMVKGKCVKSFDTKKQKDSKKAVSISN